MPARLQASDWILLYSSAQHGSSLATLYHYCEQAALNRNGGFAHTETGGSASTTSANMLIAKDSLGYVSNSQIRSNLALHFRNALYFGIYSFLVSRCSARSPLPHYEKRVIVILAMAKRAYFRYYLLRQCIIGLVPILCLRLVHMIAWLLVAGIVAILLCWSFCFFLMILRMYVCCFHQ